MERQCFLKDMFFHFKRTPHVIWNLPFTASSSKEGRFLNWVIEAELRTLTEREKIPEVEHPNIQPCHWVTLELVIARIEVSILRITIS